MMRDTETFLQIKPMRGIIFTVVYLFAAISLITLLMGGFDELVNFVNSFQRPAAIGLLSAVVLLLPALFLIRFIYPRISLRLQPGNLTLNTKNKTPLLISYDDVWKITLNTTQLNVLELWGRDGQLLYAFRPLNNPAVLMKIVSTITATSRFIKSKQGKKVFRNTYEALTYIRSGS